MAKQGRKKTLPRREFNGEELLVLYEHPGLSDIQFTKIRNQAMISEVVKLYEDITNVGAKWFWVETGRHCYVDKYDSGFVWMVKDLTTNSMNYKWLSGKVRRFCAQIVDRIDGFIDAMEVLDAEKERPD